MGWSRIPSAPIAPRARHQGITTARQLIVWGGVGGRRFGTAFRDGAAFDAEAGRWRRISELPIEPCTASASAVGPQHVFTSGGLMLSRDSPAATTAEAATLDLETLRWDVIEPMPLSPRANHLAVWVGDRVVVWGGDAGVWRRGSPARSFNDGASWDKLSSKWEPLAPCPLDARYFPHFAWDGERLITWGGQAQLKRHNRGLVSIPLDQSAPHLYTLARSTSSIQEASDEEAPEQSGAIYDPWNDSWRTIAVPSAATEPGWSQWVDGRIVLVTVDGNVVEWDPDTTRMTSRPLLHAESISLREPTTTVCFADQWIVILGAQQESQDSLIALAHNLITNQLIRIPDSPIGVRYDGLTKSEGAIVATWGGIARGTHGSEPLLENDGAYIVLEPATESGATSSDLA
jgi:hypothetical protein